MYDDRYDGCFDLMDVAVITVNSTSTCAAILNSIDLDPHFCIFLTRDHPLSLPDHTNERHSCFRSYREEQRDILCIYWDRLFSKNEKELIYSVMMRFTFVE